MTAKPDDARSANDNNKKHQNTTSDNVKKIYTILYPVLAFLITTGVYAQQEAQFTMFWNNYSLFNPAATGLFNKHYALLTGRNQWVNFQDNIGVKTYKTNPRTIAFIYDFRWDKIKSGIGINYIHSKIGFETDRGICLNYSYNHRIRSDETLSAGAAFRVLVKKIDFSKFISDNPNDPLLSDAAKKSDINYDIKMGVMYKTPRYIIGIGGTQLLQSEFGNLPFQNRTHIFINGAYDIEAGKFNIKPCALFKTDFSTSQIDIDVLTYYKKRYWAGTGWRHQDAIVFMAGVDIQGRFRLGYSYDMTTSKMAEVSEGSHELTLGLMLDKKK